jgi:hypothetical protein
VQYDATDTSDAHRASGKASFDHIYGQDDPRAYFATLRDLDYVIPQLAQPYFAKLIDELRDTRSVSVPTVIDLGCSYGINSTLLRCDLTLDELYARYGAPDAAALGRDDLVAQDRDLVRTHGQPELARFVGLDSSAPALSYAVEAGLLDAAVHADLERNEAAPEERAQLGRADLVISTGCMGYVSGRTLRRIADAALRAGRPLPWMAHSCLRMVPYGPVADSLGELGYETMRIDGVFRQRRFASAQERSGVLDSLAAAGIDPEGLEADGWLYAEIHLSIPADTRDATRLARSDSRQ